MLKRIDRQQVRLGMYIHGFEGSWFKHPFWRPRFLLTDPGELALLRASDVPGVIIDDEKGFGTEHAASALAQPETRTSPRRDHQAARQVPWNDRAFTESEERKRAKGVLSRNGKVMRAIFDGARLGRAMRSNEVMQVVDEITTAVDRNARAMIEVSRLKSKHEYTYLHSVAVCALMVNLARHLGLDGRQTRDMGLAGLLHDIGKAAVPEDILNKPACLSPQEYDVMRTHPEKGHALLSGDPGITATALDVCRHHHEKIDGSGYPFNLKGEEISLAARMGAICDVFDALTSNRVYKDASSPVEAITGMAEWHGHFDPKLLFAFMQSISVFPVGMLVRLRTNRLAVVLENGRRASRPRVKAFYSTTEREMILPEVVVISDSFADDSIISRENPADWGLTGWEMLREELLEHAIRKAA
ncbi:MAG TPA: HD-GYP domain-containing protein [Novosphingobium sp.]